MRTDGSVALARWVTDLERRHLSDLTFPEVRRGLQALSTIYVEERRRLAESAAFDGAGKRAAFALFYGPLHFLTVRDVVGALGAAEPAPLSILDLGCGTLAGGAAWAVAAGGTPRVDGVERSGWAAAEARETLRALGLAGRVAAGDLTRTPLTGGGRAILLAWTVNELPAPAREGLLPRLLQAARAGARVLVVEPIATRITPWWETWSASFRRAGGRADLWRLPGADLPELSLRLAKAAGLDPRERTARTLYHPGTSPRPSEEGSGER